ncbi:hypothetical protein [Rhizohabitans arisaemae]|uniref:hypothetical protein n=1 Tax=Rhizohabitans arisaemae TaxID=2720610 RepID=UPI0024B155E2|nr:hypothetical protein [Rhizohabitans arisaemae]
MTHTIGRRRVGDRRPINGPASATPSAGIRGDLGVLHPGSARDGSGRTTPAVDRTDDRDDGPTRRPASPAGSATAGRRRGGSTELLAVMSFPPRAATVDLGDRACDTTRPRRPH